MNNTKELKPGWLMEDMKRAERQVKDWKIKKYEDSEIDENSEQTTSEIYSTPYSDEPFSC